MMPEFSSGFAGHESRLATLFGDVFAASEGVDEGRVIKTLVSDLMATTPKGELSCFIAWDAKEIAGGIFFSPLYFDDDPRQVFLLSPVAVRTDRQKTGIGQSLIRFGLDQMRSGGADYLVTYGDPAYYGKTGFQQVSDQNIRPPFPLSMPFGWLGQSFSSDATDLIGPSRCVPAFNRAELW